MPQEQDKLSVLIETRDAWMKDRPAMKEHNSNMLQLLALLKNEVDEAIETLTNGDGKIHDQQKAVEQELADIGWFLLTTFYVHEQNGGRGMFESLMEKHARNVAKYPAFLFDGSLTYEEAIDLAKWEWKQTNGDHDFYNGKPIEGYVPTQGTPLEAPPIQEQYLPEGYVLTPTGVRHKDEVALEEVRSQIAELIGKKPEPEKEQELEAVVV